MIAIVDIDMGNLRSVGKAIYQLGHDAKLVSRPGELDLGRATRCILPGVGSFRTASERMEQSGLGDALRAFAHSGRPILGICLGMQLLADEGEEGGGAPGLGLIPGRVTRLDAGPGTRVPHVGWNTVAVRAPHPLFADVKPGRDFYFVHSYHFRAADSVVLGETEHGIRFVSVVGHKNVIGVQFHPEKSQANGLRILERFCDWDGTC